MDLFINPDPRYDEFNDLQWKTRLSVFPQYDAESYAVLRANGIDAMLSKHIAHLFIRDALVTYDDYASKDDTQSSEHFEVAACAGADP